MQGCPSACDPEHAPSDVEHYETPILQLIHQNLEFCLSTPALHDSGSGGGYELAAGEADSWVPEAHQTILFFMLMFCSCFRCVFEHLHSTCLHFIKKVDGTKTLPLPKQGAGFSLSGNYSTYDN